MRRFLPVITLILLAPIIAELLWGTTPISQAPSLLIQIPIYGAGALLIRELVRRRQGGWGSMLLLGAVYCIIEEGLALQFFFTPRFAGENSWGTQLLGINTTYVEWSIGYHMIWSIAIPILLTEILFPDFRHTPYLGRVGLIITGIFYILGAVVLGLIAHVAITPGYWASPLLLGIAVVAVLLLAFIALFVLPPSKPASTVELQGNAPSPWIMLLIAGVVGFAWQVILIWPGHFFHGSMRWPLLLIPMLIALAMALTVFQLLRRWTTARNWNDLHTLALISGALVAHTIFGILSLATTAIDRIGLGALGCLMSILLIALAFRLRQRTALGVNP